MKQQKHVFIYLFTYIFFNLYLFSILLIFYFVYNRDNRRI